MASIKNNITSVIPQDYSPSPSIDLCGNTITNYQFLFDIEGLVPILIGDGEVPRIWMYAKTSDGKYGSIIEDSVSKNSLIKVDFFFKDKYLEISSIHGQGNMILSLDFGGVLKIRILDLRPLGYNIYGNDDKLVVAGSTYSGNKFNNVHTLFKFDKSE